MKSPIHSCRMIMMLAFVLISTIHATAQDKPLTLKNLAGTWSGTLSIQSQKLRLDMNIIFNEADSAIVTFDSPDQGVLDLPTDKVTLTEDSIIASLKAIGGKYTGKINKSVDTITGSWHQGGMSFPLILTGHGKRTILNRPQEPKPPFPYLSEEVIFPGHEAGVELAGTLTMPEATGPFPAVILITGSGPQNRDEELLGHKPFLVLADYLTRQGIAVLRYDDRGTAKSTGEFKTATSLDFATDASAALDYLKDRGEIDSTRIGFIGHSEGGLIAPMVASVRPDVAFIILMAGPGITGEQILLLQSELILKAEGTDEQTIRESDKTNREIYSVLKKNSDNAKAGQKIRAVLTGYNKKHSKDENHPEISEAEINNQVETLTSPWFRTFLTLDPEDYLSKVICPLLAINGSLDLQVPPRENLQGIEKALIFGGNSNYMLEELPGLNHLFQTATTGSPTEYGKIDETISPVVLELMRKWIWKTIAK